MKKLITAIFVLLLAWGKMYATKNYFAINDIEVNISEIDAPKNDKLKINIRVKNISDKDILIPFSYLKMVNSSGNMINDFFVLETFDGNNVCYQGLVSKLNAHPSIDRCILLHPGDEYEIAIENILKHYLTKKRDVKSIYYRGPLGNSNKLILKTAKN